MGEHFRMWAVLDCGFGLFNPNPKMQKFAKFIPKCWEFWVFEFGLF